jgi:hypothetical protein
VNGSGIERSGHFSGISIDTGQIGVSTLTGCLVVAAFVLNDSLTKVDANVAFNGISDIVSSHGKDKPFNIVEVVPDKKMASIGYLIDGQEPDDWFGTLSRMSDKDGAGVQKRSAYMEELKTKLAPITTEKKDNTKPLYYEPYEESYVSQGDDWTELALVDMDRINKGTTGYKMTEQAEGDYKFNTDYQLAVNEDGLPTGHYRQNVDHYVFMQGEDETEDGSNTETDLSEAAQAVMLHLLLRRSEYVLNLVRVHLKHQSCWKLGLLAAVPSYNVALA